VRSVNELETEIRGLSVEDRMHLLRDLIAELDGVPDAGVERAWLAEAERRYHEITAGTAKLIPADQVFAQARAKLK
ncbi:MAG: addiction module protein, partial [Nitrosomonas sp.]|nr:addiction module protein [Nitrosomonas sp.]